MISSTKKTPFGGKNQMLPFYTNQLETYNRPGGGMVTRHWGKTTADITSSTKCQTKDFL